MQSQINTNQQKDKQYYNNKKKLTIKSKRKSKKLFNKQKHKMELNSNHQFQIKKRDVRKI